MTTFAGQLRTALGQRGMTRAELARRVGLSKRGLDMLANGHNLPTPKNADAIAEVLNWPPLLAALQRQRERTCAVCGAAFYSSFRRVKACSDSCANTLRQRRLRDKKLRYDRAIRNRLATHQSAVAAFCLSCEPDGLCRDAECALRPVSPLPWVPLSAISRRKVA